MKTVTFNPKEIPASELQSFIDKLYAVQEAVFEGVSREEFVKYSILSSAEITEIEVMVNNNGEFVGYCAVHYFEKTIKERDVTIIRGETGILPEYRAHGNVNKIMLKNALNYKRKNRKRFTYSLSCFVSPVTYYMLAKNAYEIYPNVKRELPKHVEELMDNLAEVFSMEQVEGASKYVKKVGWIVKQSSEDRLRLDESSSSQIKFFKELNPDYTLGHGLQTIYPLSSKNMFFTLLNKFLSNYNMKFKFRKF